MSIIMKNKEPDKIYTGSKALASLLVANCANKLNEHYPYHYWHVSMVNDMSVINIKCLNITGEFGYTLHTQIVESDPDLRCVMRAGGEILERAKVNRGRDDGILPSSIDLGGVNKKRLKGMDKNKTSRILHHGR